MPRQLYHNTAQGHGGQLVAGAYTSCEDDGIGRSSEHVSMHLLPAILITNITLLQIGTNKDYRVCQ